MAYGPAVQSSPGGPGSRTLRVHQLRAVGCIVERRNDEFYAEYLQVKEEMLNEGMSERKANREAIEGEPRGYRDSRNPPRLRPNSCIRVCEGTPA